MTWILVALVVLYVAGNVRRVRHGKKWAFGVCRLAKEWEAAERERIAARRATS